MVVELQAAIQDDLHLAGSGQEAPAELVALIAQDPLDLPARFLDG
jgi:hypothetical protein